MSINCPNAARLLTRTQIDEKKFPICPPGKLTTPGFVAYWFWDLRPALRGSVKVDDKERFCAYFLLSLNGDNHLPLHIAVFLCNICRKVRKRTDFSVELDDIGIKIQSGGIISGYVQFRTDCLRSVQEWVEQRSLWMIDAYGPVHYETTSNIIGHHTILAWQTIICATVEYVALLSCDTQVNPITFSKTTHISWLKTATTRGGTCLCVSYFVYQQTIVANVMISHVKEHRNTSGYGQLLTESYKFCSCIV